MPSRVFSITAFGAVGLGIVIMWFFSNFLYSLLWGFLEEHHWREADLIAYALAHLLPFILSATLMALVYGALRLELRTRRMELALLGTRLAVDEDGPLRREIVVNVHNATGQDVGQCRLQVAPISRAGKKHYSGNIHIPVTEPFSLLVDDTKQQAIFEYPLEESKGVPATSKNILISQFFENKGKWERYDGGLVLTYGDYEIVVEALSSHAQKAALTLFVSWRNGRWQISPHTFLGRFSNFLRRLTWR